jgi:hypothetical protein
MFTLVITAVRKFRTIEVQGDMMLGGDVLSLGMIILLHSPKY